nr:hypothetical protein CFP56_13764 [Quercus suber]
MYFPLLIKFNITLRVHHCQTENRTDNNILGTYKTSAQDTKERKQGILCLRHCNVQIPRFQKPPSLTIENAIPL